MKFELKNIKFAEFASEETHCYQATLWVDGKPTFIVGNEGRGGPDSIDPFGNKRWKDVKPKFDEVMAWIKAQPKIKTDWGEMENALDIICNDLLTKHLATQKLKRALKTKVLFTNDGSLFELRIGNRPLQQVVDHIKSRYPKSTILNNLPEPKAIELALRF